jgi:hypothetical protein
LVRGFNMRHVCLPFLLLIASLQTGCIRQNEGPSRHRIIISSDIGGTDPDDNQSMIHLLMYSDKFQIEGLISSPSYGEGSKQEIYQLIDLYKQDFKLLSKKSPEFPQPSYLRSVCKQGRRGSAPFAGHGLATEGSDWIIHSAMKETEQPFGYSFGEGLKIWRKHCTMLQRFEVKFVYIGLVDQTKSGAPTAMPTWSSIFLICGLLKQTLRTAVFFQTRAALIA